ncbi:MAG TPA: GNAT family N-acetyltransferase [Nocardioides sp.]|uniref:GNAT family N-acetyltransferase n=1 Tax=Nocardioides sp. TaxID=35761 RepID=UPI002D7EB148|nr:GNAT family N-acetyltransferase [Nocardioides sp.]HET6654405.1 GNAT family N-acetyltransferase [Nocardioides sp.]
MTDTSTVIVRFAGPEDWETWRDLRLRALQDTPSAFGSTYEREVGYDRSRWVERLANPDGVSVLAWIRDTAVGMGAGFQDLPAFLHVVAMWTDPAYRSRGVGSAVLTAIERWAGERGLRLHIEVNVANAGARALYERAGYAGTGEVRPLRDGSDERIERMVHG